MQSGEIHIFVGNGKMYVAGYRFGKKILGRGGKLFTKSFTNEDDRKNSVQAVVFEETERWKSAYFWMRCIYSYS